MRWVEDDGGRADAGFRGTAGDCVARAVAIAMEIPYADAYAFVADVNASHGAARSARDGVSARALKSLRTLLVARGWTWTPTMRVGSGCTVHLRDGELPDGRLIVRVSGHLCAVVDGMIHDTYDPSRGGTRCVYGYWRREEF